MKLMSTTYMSNADWNESNFDSPELDGLPGEITSTVDPDRQRALITEALTLIADEAGTLIPAFLPRLWLKNKQLQGFDLSVPMRMNLRGAWLA